MSLERIPITSTQIAGLAQTQGTINTLLSFGTAASEIAEITKVGTLGIKTASHALGASSQLGKTGIHLLSQIESPATAASTAMGALIPLVPITALGAETLTLGLRLQRALELRKERDTLPVTSEMPYKHKVLDAQSKHVQGKIKSSGLGVVSSTVGVVGSFVPVVGSVPAAVFGTSVALIRFVVENGLDSELLEDLEKITRDYRASHPEIIQNHVAFTELRETLKNHLEKAVQEKQIAEKAFLEAEKAYEKVVHTLDAPEAHRKLSEAASALNRAEIAVQDVSKHLEKYELARGDFDAYAQALLLIRDLEPKESPVADREPENFTSSLLSTFGTSESIAFASTSEFPSEHISESSTRAQRLLREIGITSEEEERLLHGAAPKIEKTAEPTLQKEDTEKVDLIQFAKFATTNEF